MRSRLGDDIDDFCVKCKRVMNHLVVSLLNDEPAKVRCRTCHGDHDFRHEQAPPPKIDARKAALIQQALEQAQAATAGSALVPNGGDIAGPVAIPDAAAIAAAIPMDILPELVAIPEPAATVVAARASGRKSARSK